MLSFLLGKRKQEKRTILKILDSLIFVYNVIVKFCYWEGNWDSSMNIWSLIFKRWISINSLVLIRVVCLVLEISLIVWLWGYILSLPLMLGHSQLPFIIFLVRLRRLVLVVDPIWTLILLTTLVIVSWLSILSVIVSISSIKVPLLKRHSFLLVLRILILWWWSELI
jgi:hypothetical protein